MSTPDLQFLRTANLASAEGESFLERPFGKWCSRAAKEAFTLGAWTCQSIFEKLSQFFLGAASKASFRRFTLSIETAPGRSCSCAHGRMGFTPYEQNCPGTPALVLPQGSLASTRERDLLQPVRTRVPASKTPLTGFARMGMGFAISLQWAEPPLRMPSCQFGPRRPTPSPIIKRFATVSLLAPFAHVRADESAP